MYTIYKYSIQSINMHKIFNVFNNSVIKRYVALLTSVKIFE